MGEALVSRRGGDGSKGFGAQNTSSTANFTSYGNLSLNCDWITIATIPISGEKNIVAVVTEGYSAAPRTIALTNIGKEISVTLGGDGRKGIMSGRVVKNGDNYLLQVKQSDAVSTLYVSFYWAIGN